MADVMIPNADLLAPPSFKDKEELFESESTTSNSDISTTQNSVDSLSTNDITPGHTKTSNLIDRLIKSTETSTDKNTRLWRFLILGVGVIFMFCARFNVPVNDVKNLQDNVLDFFLPINNWIHNNSNSFGPKILLFCCATNMDIIFTITMAYWVIYGKSARLPIALCIFYLTRTLVQQMSFQPFPAGYYWDSPGFPSFVAPYGRSTDFFFSGHSGFLVLMANEWKKVGSKWMHRYVLTNLVYTIFVLLICQAHYSIDIFTGVFFADYVFGRVDNNKDAIDGVFRKIAEYIEKFSTMLLGTKSEEPIKKQE